jgi:sigma-B regulation protein RsbU (phosphoserine phosphatase)
MSNNHSTDVQMGRAAVGTDIASRLFPCRGRNRAALDYYGESQLADSAGGDFFELISFEPNGLVAITGHVSGRSAAAAALLIPGLRGYLRTRLPDEARNIRNVVRDLNRMLCDTSPDSFYAALFCAAIDPGRHELHYVNAGHEPALLVRSDGERVCRLESTGAVLGLTTRAAYGVRTIALEQGDVLAAFSDGVVDAADRTDRIFGSSGVLEVLRERANARSSDLVWQVLDAVGHFADPAKPAEDRTLAIARFKDVLAQPLAETEAEEAAFAAA